jgi:signal transduction histidine kinase
MNDQTATTTQLAAPDAAPSRRGGKLFRKYILLFVALVGGTLLANGALELWFSYQENKEALAQVQHEKALAAAARIEQFIDEITRQIGWTTRAQWSRTVLEQRRFEYLQLLRQAPAVTEVSHLDAQGKEELRVSRLAMDVIGSGTDFSADPKFAEAKARKTWFSPVYFRKESEPYITVAIAGTGRDSGVTVAEVNLKFIWDVISRIKVGQAGYAYVVDTRGLLIAHPDIGLVLRKTDFSELPQVASTLADPGQQVAIVGADSAGRQVLTAHASITPLDWTVFVDLPIAEAFAPLYVSMQRSAALVVLGLALAVGAGLLLARRMVVPIQALQSGAARIGAGDLDHRIAIKTGDELEALADQFNSMTAQLEESYASLERKVEDRTQELRESLEYQTATSDVLKVISRSRVDLQPVLDTLVETAARLCLADGGFLFQLADGAYRVKASTEVTPEIEWFIRNAELYPGEGTLVGRVALRRSTVHIEDSWSDDQYTWEAAQKSFRTLLGVPLLRDGEPIGVFSLFRFKPHRFTDKQIELVTTFADQAVIAIENARLLKELQARTEDLSESLDQQTATSEVLKVISRSRTDLQPVLDTLVKTAAELCRSDRTFLFRLSDGLYRMSASYGWTEKELAFEMAHPLPPGEGTLIGRAALLRQPVHIEDALTDPGYTFKEAQQTLGFRTLLGVPLLRDGEPIGVFAAARTRVEPFTAKQIELMTTFADQAVIAIENTRLLDALQARTDELGRSVEELTATSEVLRVIASSPGKLEPVLEAVAENAARLCEADDVGIHRLEGDQLRYVASHGGLMQRLVAERVAFSLTSGSVAGRAVIERRNIHVPDMASVKAEYPDSPANHYDGARSARTVLAVPLLREGSAIGDIVIIRSEIRPFTAKQIELVTSFADQAVIAIENARLLDELQARTAELTRSVDELKALGEVGRAVSSTLDLKTVLDTVVARGTMLGEAEACSIYRYRPAHRQFKLWHAAGLDAAFATTLRALEVREDETLMGRAVQLREPVQIADLNEVQNMPLRDASLAAGYHAVLIVPLVRADRVFGALVLNRREPGEFSNSTVNLLRTFASQSILAIQNAQLFQEIEDKSRQLQIASQHKSQFLANMSHELRTPLNAILGYTELLIDGLYGKLGDKAQSVLERVQTNGKHLLGLINDVLDLAKIEAGQLTLTLTDYAVGAVVQSVVAATESLAKAKGLELRAELAPAMPLGHGDERRLTQVLLNLVGNAIKFTDSGSITVSAVARDGRFKLAVRDTGPGIAAADQARIFEEFQQVDNSSTRKKGGTGLGLSISKKIVEMHGGTITVESELGAGATFRVDLPIRLDDAREVA